MQAGVENEDEEEMGRRSAEMGLHCTGCLEWDLGIDDLECLGWACWAGACFGV